MKQALLLLVGLTIVSACSKDDTATPEPEPVQVPKYTVSITARDGGTISSAGGTYDKDTQISITATPNAEYLFQAWSDGNTDNPRSIKVTADLTITANFVKKQYDLTINVVGEGAVSEEVVIQGGRYNSGSQIKLTATAAEGWEFVSWSGAIESTDNPVTVNINEGREVTATFTRKKYDLTVTVVGEGTVTEEVVVQPSQYDYETQVKLTAVPAEGWEFSAWSGDLESTENPVTITLNDTTGITVTFTLKDSDGDGVPDINDNCPDSSSGEVDETGCQIPPIYLDSNGVTIKARDWAELGQSYELNGVFYKVVDRTMLDSMIDNDEDLTKVVTSKITDMAFLFGNKKLGFNQDIGSWDVSNVTNMRGMFYVSNSNGRAFNQDIGSWDVSNVTFMESMFQACVKFNQDINDWDVSNVTNMRGMFQWADEFNQPLNAWDTSKVTNMEYMFSGAESFNQSIDNWNMSNVTSIEYMFEYTKSFNQDLNNWDLQSITSLDAVFRSAEAFNGVISEWDTSRIINMRWTFWGAKSFNQDIGGWDVSKVESYWNMFNEAQKFNQDIGDWNTEKAYDMRGMFASSGTVNLNGGMSFNQDLSDWKVDNVFSCAGFDAPGIFADRNADVWTLPKPNFTNCTP